MKSADEIRKRLEKIRMRCLRQYCSDVLSKKPRNCMFNLEHVPRPQKSRIPTEMEMVPRTVSTLVVVEPATPVRLCMYGSTKPDLWNGDLCEDDKTAQACPYFTAKVTEEQATAEFNELMSQDDYVLEHHKDMAALQWVLGERIYKSPLSLWDRFLLWTDGLRRPQKHKLLPPTEPVDPLEDLWRNADVENSGK